jgi:hypothetical protein
MKPSIFFLLPFVFFARCKSNNSGRPHLPEEYTLNKADKEKGKTMVYLNRSSNESHYKDLFYIKKDNRQYLVQREHDGNKATDSMIYSPTHMVEMYSAVLGDSLMRPVEILLDTIIDNGKKLGKNKALFRMTNDSTQMDISAEVEYLKDTVFTWQEKTLPTLALKAHYEFFVKELATGRSMPVTVDYHSYYAKGIGLVRTIVFDQRNNSFPVDLVEIRDLVR